MYLGNVRQVVSHDRQRCPQRLLHQPAELLEGALVPPLIHVLEGEQRLPLRVIPAPPQDTWVIPLVGLRLYPHEG